MSDEFTVIVVDDTENLVVEIKNEIMPDIEVSISADPTAIIVEMDNGIEGPVGPQGPVGVGVPSGGSIGQILAKKSSSNFDTEWRDGVLVTSVYNQTGSIITKGSIVYINGAHGNLPTIALSRADSEMGSTKTYGFVVADISDNSSGSVVAAGQIRDLNTFGVTEGVTLWLSPTVYGGYTTTKPIAPNHAVVVGVCTRAHPTQGTIEVKIQNGYELEELHNVLISSPANGQILQYDATTSLWKNATVTGSGTVTNVSVVSSNGLSGTVTNPTTTPSITLSTTVTGVLKGNGTSISAASAGTDYQAPITGGASSITTSNLTASRTLVSDASGKVSASSVTSTTLSYLDATSSVQTQLNSKQATITGAATSITTTNLSTNKALESDSSGKVQASSITSTELSYLSGASSNVQTQINSKEPTLTKGNLSETTSSVLTITGGTGSVIGSGTSIQVKQSSTGQSGYLSSTDFTTFNNKQNTITGAATSVTTSNLSASKVLVSDGSGKIAASSVTSTTLGYLDATSSVQTQINSKEPTLTKGNLSTSTTGVSVGGGTGSVIGSGTSIDIQTASSSQNGLLSSSDWTSFNSKTSLTSSTPNTVGSSNAVGTASDAARADHTHKGVSSIAKNGSAQLFGDVTLTGGSNITLTQAGNDISIAASGAGTVTDVSVVSANGFAGSVATSTTTPAITISTSVSGILKGNGTAVSAATAGTDYQSPITQGNLSESTSAVLTITGGTNAVIGAGTSIEVKQSSSSQSGYLSSTDWSTFNSKEPTVTKGNLSGSTPISVSGGTGAVIGAGASISISPADAFNSGYLTSSDFQIFSNKEPALTKGNLTEATSSVLTITGGTNSVIGTGTTVEVKEVTTSQSGYLATNHFKDFLLKNDLDVMDYSARWRFGSTSPVNMNSQSTSTSGTLAAVSYASTNLMTKIPNVTCTTTSTPGTNTGFRVGGTVTYTLLNVGGGFKFSHIFQIDDATALNQSRLFVGLSSTSAAIPINTSTNTDPLRATFTNFICVGHDSFFGDTNLKIFHNAGTAGSTTVVDLGSGFSITAGADVYQANFYNLTNTNDVYYDIIGLVSGNRAAGKITSNVPTTVGLYAHSTRTNGGNAAVARLRAASLQLYQVC